MVKKISIDTNFSFKIIGLKSNKKSIQLVNFFNRIFDISLTEKIIIVDNEMSFFYFVNNNSKIIFFENKFLSRKTSLLKQFNYFLLVDNFDLDSFFSTLKNNLDINYFYLIEKNLITKEIDKIFSFIYSQI